MLLVTIAALGVFAVFGAGSASATVLCKNSLTPCTSPYPAGTELHAELISSEASLSPGFGTFNCTESQVGLRTTSAGSASEAVDVSLQSLSFSGCNATVNVTALGSGNIEWTEAANGTVTGSGTNLEIISGATRCYYGGSITQGLTLKGGSAAQLVANNIELERQAGSSSLCANPAKFNASYVATGESATAFVAQAPSPGSTLCKSNTTPCSSPYPVGTVFSSQLSSSLATLAAGFSTVKCTESAAQMEVTSTGGLSELATAKISGLSFAGCNATVTVLAKGSASVSRVPGTVNGNLGESGTEVEIVGGTTKCFYGGEITSGLVLEGGAPSTVSATKVPLTKEAGSGALCANPSKFTAQYTLTGENSTLYVSET
jgi:hypothetical protein